MFRYVLCLVVLPAATFSQFITLRDGKIGVNFAGYHAEAGLGGLLTGNAAHGGLSASAGTPFGQRAGAGIGGTVNDGQTRGGAFAGASAGYGVGASAAIGGNVDGSGTSGGLGSEAHAPGVSTKTVKLSQTPQIPQQTINEVDGDDGSLDARFDDEEGLDEPQTPAPQPRGRRPHPKVNKYATSRFNKQSPPQAQPSFDFSKFFDFGFYSNLGASFAGAPHPATQNGREISYTKQIDPNTVLRRSQPQDSTSDSATTRVPPTLPPNFFNDIFNIPISVLGAVNTFLNNNVKPGNSNSAASSGGSASSSSSQTL